MYMNLSRNSRDVCKVTKVEAYSYLESLSPTQHRSYEVFVFFPRVGVRRFGFFWPGNWCARLANSTGAKQAKAWLRSSLPSSDSSRVFQMEWKYKVLFLLCPVYLFTACTLAGKVQSLFLPLRKDPALNLSSIPCSSQLLRITKRNNTQGEWHRPHWFYVHM